MAGPSIISGKVVGRDGRPIAMARIYFTAGPQPLPEIAALTNDDGTFSLTAPQPGKYSIQCAADGFATKSVTVTVSQGQTVHLDIELKREK
ncbi:MAG: carboxypeptidase-like regulatory domain-containing protein [Pyrinomonadaceae bacterium]